MKRLISVLLILALCVFAACGDDSSESDDSNQSNTNNTNNANNDNNDNNDNNGSEFDNTGIEYQSSYQLRFDSLVFDSDTAGRPVNGILEQNFDQSLDFPVVVLVDLRNIDTEGGSLELRGGSGLKTETDGEYSWDPEGAEDYFNGSLTAATGAFVGELGRLDFVATLQTETDVQKVVIPIRELEFEGNLVLAGDGSTGSIPNGRLAGYLTKEDGDNTEVRITPTSNPVTVTDLFGADKLNYDSTAGEIVTEGEGDAWYLTADFSAVPTIIIE